ncbi:MAG: VanZ family protein [Thermoguttaceae bacterium]
MNADGVRGENSGAHAPARKTFVFYHNSAVHAPARNAVLSIQSKIQIMTKYLRQITIFYWVFLTMLLWLPDPRVLLFGWTPSEGPSGYAHLITFSLLGFLVKLAFAQNSTFSSFIILVSYAFVTEIVQNILPIRAFEWLDIAQDTIGITIGIIVALFVKTTITRFNHN